MLTPSSTATQLLQQDDGVYEAAAASHALPIVRSKRALAQQKASAPQEGKRTPMTDIKLKSLKPTDRLQKVAERALSQSLQNLQPYSSLRNSLRNATQPRTRLSPRNRRGGSREKIGDL